MLNALRTFLRRRRTRSAAASDWRAGNDARIARLRRLGATVGEQCVIFAEQVPLEAYLLEIGDRVAVAGGTVFLTHDGAAWLLRRTRTEAQHFGRIVVGSDTFIGQNCLILPGARIGAHCVVGAGAVVRGTIPDGTVALGNPAAVVGRTSLFLAMMDASPDTLDTFSLSAAERERRVRDHFGRT